MCVVALCCFYGWQPGCFVGLATFLFCAAFCEQTERAADYGKKQSWLLMKGDLNQGKRYVGI